MIDFIYHNGKFVPFEPKSELEQTKERLSELRLELAQVKSERDNWRAVAEVRGKTIEEYGQKLADADNSQMTTTEAILKIKGVWR